MLGVELVTDRQKKAPAKAETLYVMEKMKRNVFFLVFFLPLYRKTKLMLNIFYTFLLQRLGCAHRKRWLLWKCLQSYYTTSRFTKEDAGNGHAQSIVPWIFVFLSLVHFYFLIACYFQISLPMPWITQFRRASHTSV